MTISCFRVNVLNTPTIWGNKTFSVLEEVFSSHLSDFFKVDVSVLNLVLKVLALQARE